MTEEQEIRIRQKAARIVSDACWSEGQRRHIEELEGCLLLLVRLNHGLAERVSALERGR